MSGGYQERVVDIFDYADDLTVYDNPYVEGATPPAIQDNPGTVQHLARRHRRATVMSDGYQERVVDIFDYADDLTVYDNPYVEEATPPAIQDNPGTVQHLVTISSEKKRLNRAAAVCGGLLCLFLLAGIIGQGVYSSANKTKWNVERDQIWADYVNLTKERDTLRQIYNNVTEDRDKLKIIRDNLARERDQLKTDYSRLMEKICDLQIHIYELPFRECPEGWLKFGCSCYYISIEKKTWEESRQDCLTSGADLVIINNRVEQSFISRSHGRFWIGLSDQVTEGTWTWVDGSYLINNGFWAKGEPNNYGRREDCVEFRSARNGWNRWNDRFCSSQLLYICEKPNYDI